MARNPCSSSVTICVHDTLQPSQLLGFLFDKTDICILCPNKQAFKYSHVQEVSVSMHNRPCKQRWSHTAASPNDMVAMPVCVNPVIVFQMTNLPKGIFIRTHPLHRGCLTILEKQDSLCSKILLPYHAKTSLVCPQFMSKCAYASLSWSLHVHVLKLGFACLKIHCSSLQNN